MIPFQSFYNRKDHVINFSTVQNANELNEFYT